jgi:hypothetical protein
MNERGVDVDKSGGGGNGNGNGKDDVSEGSEHFGCLGQGEDGNLNSFDHIDSFVECVVDDNLGYFAHFGASLCDVGLGCYFGNYFVYYYPDGLGYKHHCHFHVGFEVY